MTDIMKKVPVPEQAGDVRNKNFEEVSHGYTDEMAVREAERCLQCKTRPCAGGCPVGVRIPEFIGLIKQKDFAGAYAKIKETNALPAVCGRVCPQENQCEGKCVRAVKGESVAIGRLERFAADYARENSVVFKMPAHAENSHKAAILGAGPAGLTCAGILAANGFAVTVFEAFHKAGGVLVYGIPEFRLPKHIVESEIQGLRDAGVEIVLNAVAGRAFTTEELFEQGYSYVFIGTGAGLPVFMNIPGESLAGVFSANEYLTRVNLMKAYDDNYDTPIVKGKNVAVVGGGNVAMDAARCAKRMGAENVYIVYRRSMNELPARAEEVHHAEEEGIVFMTLTAPVEILGETNVTSVKCIKMELGEPDASGRRSPAPVTGSEFTLDADVVIMAIGTKPNPIISNTSPQIKVNKRGCIIADESGATSMENVYAGGDAVTGAATVILAMGAGKIAAEKIISELKD